MVKLYHPELGTDFEASDDPDQLAIYEKSGWKRAPEPKSIPGHEPEPVTYAPVEPKPARKASPKK